MSGDENTSRLRELRDERGWTQEEVAEQLARLAWLEDEERVGVNADMVSKWERGQGRPGPKYRKLYCLLFGVALDQLGLGLVDKRPAAQSTADSSLLSSLGGAASLLDQLGPAGAILQPKMFDAWKDELMQRRALLKLIGMTSAATVAADRNRSRSGEPTPEVIRDLDHLAGRYQQLYHSTAPASLITPVVAHLDTVAELLRESPAPAERRRLLVNRAGSRPSPAGSPSSTSKSR